MDSMNLIITQTIAICGLITGVAAVITLIIKAVVAAKRPNQLQNDRLDAIESRLKKHEELFLNDLKRFEKLEDGNRITQRAILALLAHGIDGNAINEMRKAKDELQNYLINQ